MRSRPWRVTSPAPRDVWCELLASDPDAVIYQTPEWLDCVCQATGWKDVSRLYETGADRQVVLPMVQAPRLPPRMATRASLPANWGYADIIASPGDRIANVRMVAADLAADSCLRTSVKPGPASRNPWEASVRNSAVHITHTVHTLDLTGGFSEVWGKRFPSKTRTKVRKVESADIDVEYDDTGRLMPVYYDLYKKSIERWATRERLPRAVTRLRWLKKRERLDKFLLVSRHLQSACRVWVATVQGSPAAAVITLVHGANAMYWRSAMDRDLAGRANYLLQKLAIEDACAEGCTRYFMGESTPSIAEYKSAFGARPQDYTEFRFERIPLTRTQDRARMAGERLNSRLSGKQDSRGSDEIVASH